MRHLLLAVLLAGACGPRAGEDCPLVPQVGQPCKSSGAVCIYQQPNQDRCVAIPEYKCQNGRWVQTFAPVPTWCDASADAPADAPSDAPNDAPNDAAGD